MLALQIDNPEVENIFNEQFKSNKNDFIDFITRSLKHFKKDEVTLQYITKNPFENMKKLEYEDKEKNLTNPFENIDDVVSYSKKLRSESWR